MPGAENLNKRPTAGAARVYDMDILAEKTLSGARNVPPDREDGGIPTRYLQPRLAEEPESLKREKEKAVLAEGKSRQKAAGRRSIIRDRSQKNSYLPEFIAFTLIGTLLLLLIIGLSARINETTKQVSDLQGRVIELTELEKDLSLKLEVKNDIRIIEEMASREFGMVKADNLTKEHVSINNDDKVVVYEESETAQEVFSTVMSIIGNAFDTFFEKIY